MKCAAVFSDNMVLQRNRCVRIFGECEKNEVIAVSVPELNITVNAAVSGNKWEAVLPPAAECDKCTVSVCSGIETVTFKNVAFGEVWLAGGQSNMEFELQNEKNGAEELKVCSEENVRFYYTPKCGMVNEELLAAEKASCWAEASEENSKKWSAVGYFFAKELSRKLGCTVGIIGCNWGGTSASAWIPREYIEQEKCLLPYLEKYDSYTAGKSNEDMIREYDEYLEYDKVWGAKMLKCYEETPDISWDEVLEKCGESRYPGPMGIKNPMRPCGLYDTMVSRICPYTVKGVLWYQGESDDHSPDTYYTLLSTLIRCWRDKWHDDNMPFMIVQLPMHRYKDDPDTKNWAIIREAQMKVYQTVHNTGLAVALDCGEFNNIHPVEKKTVAHRLYLEALSEVYEIYDEENTDIPCIADVIKTQGRIRLVFSDTLVVKGEPSGFETVGINGNITAVRAAVSHKTVILEADASDISEIRYLWTNYADVTLFGKNGIPIPTFRMSLDKT